MISVRLKPGTYVVAVSGGVDSMVLLDVVRQLPDVRLIVAHVNHGIREDATEDAKLVRAIAMSHNLPYEEVRLQLRSNPSEEEARTARYDFLRHVGKKYNAAAILTAHHKDDVIETAMINLLRGTGWRGLSSLRSTDGIIRPFLKLPKAELEAYGRQHALQWRYDSTNDELKYMRNDIRRRLVPHLPPQKLEEFYQYIVRQNDVTVTIDREVAQWLGANALRDSSTAALPRYEFIMMPQHVAHELLQSVLRQLGGKSITRPLADRALLFIKVAKSSKTFPLGTHWQLRALPRQVIVERRLPVVS